MRLGLEGFRGQFGRAMIKDGVLGVWGFTPSSLAQKILMGGLRAVQEETEKGNPVVIYACYAGTHSSILASRIHLGEKITCRADIASIPFFDQRLKSDIGVPLRLGQDAYGSAVYALGTGWLSKEVEWALLDAVECAIPEARVCLCHIRPVLDLRARVGGFLSRRLSVVKHGRILVSTALFRRLALMEDVVGRCLDRSSLWHHNERQSQGEVVFLEGRGNP